MILAAAASGLAGVAGGASALAALRAAARRRSSVRAAALLNAGTGTAAPVGLAARVSPAVLSIARLLETRLPQIWLTRYDARLRSAALAPPWSGSYIWGWKVFALVSALVLFGAASQSGLVALLAGTLAFFLPDLFVSERARLRDEAFRAALPDAMDLLTLMVEAGLSFDSAAARYVQQGSPSPLRDEIARFLSEVRIGRSKAEALAASASRVTLAEYKAFAAALSQADRMGTPVSEILRLQSAQARLARSQAAETRAHEAPVKMLFPLVAFILPAVFVVLLGPIVLMLSRQF